MFEYLDPFPYNLSPALSEEKQWWNKTIGERSKVTEERQFLNRSG
jgi:hypothetical protein